MYDGLNMSDDPKKLANMTLSIFLEEKRQFLKAEKAFNKFSKSCTDFEKKINQSSSENFHSLRKINENTMKVDKFKTGKTIRSRMDGKKNDIRPPLVGQASTSSNESSIDLHENNSSADEETKKIGLYTFEPRPRYEGAPASSESSDKNSNDEIQIITQIPRVSLDRNYPVGCSNVTSADTSLELPDGRIPTPSSVSSINSKRGLEWDNLGDVGYSNVHSASLSDTLGDGGGDRDSCTIGQDTLERIVSMETERRFDPEGTTESLGNPPPSGPLPLTPMPPLPANTPSLTILSGAKPLQFQLGKPVAESTPNSNNQTARDYKNGSKEYNASNRDYSGSNKDYSGSNKDKSGPNREYIASSRDYVGSGSNREYTTSNKEYSGPNNEYNTANKDYSNPSKEYSTSKKDYGSFNKERASYRDHSSNQGATSNVFANKGNRNVEGTVGETYDGPIGNRNNDAAVGQIYDGPLGNSDGAAGHYEAPFGSSSDNDPITEYEIRKRQRRSDGVPSDSRSHKSEGDKGEDRRNQKSGDNSQRMYSKHCMERNELSERDKDNVERRDDEKDRERLVKRDEAKKRSGEGSGHRRSEREATDGRKDKKKEDRGMSGDFEEVLAKYGRGRTRREDIGGSSQRSGGSKSASHSSSSQPYWGSSSRSSSRKTYDSSDVPSSSKNSPSNRENAEQSNEQLKIETENLAPTVGTVGSNKNSPTVHSNPTFSNESYSSCEKPTFEATKRRASQDKGHRSGEHATDVSDRVRKTTGSEREGNDEKAVDQCRKNNEHIKQIVEKYNESLKQHRQQMKQTDQQHKQHQQHQNLQYPHKYQEQQHENPQQHVQHQKHREQYSQHRNHDQQNQQPTKTIPQEQLKQTEHPKNYPHHLSEQENQQTKKKESFLPPISLKEVRPSTSGHEKSTNKSLTSRLPRKATSYERVDRILPEDTSVVESLEEIYFRESRPIRNQLQSQINTETYKVNSSLEQINDERKNHRVREKDMRNPLQLKHRRKYYRLFPHCTEDGSGLRRTNSLEHMLESEGLKSSTLPRYHSVSSLTLDGNEDSGCYDGDFVQGAPHHHPMLLPPLPPPYSASSSSLSTIITKRADAEASPRRLSKLSQTSSAVQSSVTTQTVPCTEDGGVCTGVHPRRTGTQHIAPSHNTSDVEDNVLLIRESNPGDCKTNCNTLDSIGSEETVGSWVGKTYYNNRYERKPDGENLEDNPGKYPTRKPKPKMPLPPDASPNERSPESVNGPFNAQSSRVTSPYNDRLFSEMYNTRDGYNNEGRSSDGGRDVDNQDMEGGEADNPDARLQTVERSDQIDRVNSFEYLPGAVYEQNQATQNSSSDDLEEEKDDLDPEPEVNALFHSVSSSSLSSTLQCDVITGVNFIQDLLAHSSNSKKFIKHFVHTLIKNSSHDLVNSHEANGTRKSIGVNAPYSKNFGLIERENRKYKTSCEQRPLNVVKATEPIELSQKKIDESPDEEFGVGNNCVRSETLRNDERCVESGNGDCAGKNQSNGAQYYENNKHDFSGKNKSDYIGKNNDRGNHIRNRRQCIENDDFTGNYRKIGDHIRDKHVNGMNHIRNGLYCEKANGDFTETNKKNGDYIKHKNSEPDDNIQNSKHEYTEQRKNSRQCNGKTNPGRIRHDYQGVDHNKQSLQNNHTKDIDFDKHRNRNINLKNREGDRFENGTDPNSRYRNEKDRYVNDINDKNRYRNTILHQNVPFTPVSAAVEGREEQSREENISGESATKSSMGVLSDVTPERDGEHTTSSDFFKPSPKAYNLQPSILFARAHSTTLTSEEDSHRQSLTLPTHKTKLRPLSPPNQPTGQYVSEPTDSRSEEEPAAITRQEMALRRLYEKQSQANRNKLNQPTSKISATNTQRAVSAGVQVKSILTNRKRDSADTSPTLSSHPSPPSPSKVGGANSGDDNWRSPVTESEKLYAMRQRAGAGQPNGKTAGAEDKDPLVGYLQLERQNQLDWIKAEIDHLNNLKDLLEKQETLKRSLSAYKQTRRIRKTLTQASSSTQPVQPGVSEPAGGSNLRPAVQESAGPKLDARLGGDENLKAAEKDGESIYAHKMDKDRASREERGRLLLPCEYKRKRSVLPPSSLKLKHNINEMMTRSVQTLQLDKHAKSKVSSAPEPTTSVTARPGPSIESTAIQTSDSILNLPHWLHQPQSVQPSLLAQDKSSDKENSVCPCLAALVSRLEEEGGEGEGREGLRGMGMGRCKCYGGEEEKAGGKARKDTPPPPAVGYVITFQPRSKKSKKLKPKPIEPEDKASSTGGTSSDTDVTTKPRVKSLQEYLEENRPDYVSRAEVRRQCLAEKSYLREQLDSTQHKQRILLAALQCGDSPSPVGGDTRVKPRGPGVRKIFTTRELRSMTRRKYLNLPEVQMKKMDAKRKEDYRTNKLMAEVFTKKLQRKALKGVVDLSNSDQVLGQIS